MIMMTYLHIFSLKDKDTKGQPIAGIWDELSAGTPGNDASVGVMSHPDSIHRTAGYVTRMSDGVGGGGRKVPPYPD